MLCPLKSGTTEADYSRLVSNLHWGHAKAMYHRLIGDSPPSWLYITCMLHLNSFLVKTLIPIPSSGLHSTQRLARQE
jgi:hypothetical protein